MALTRMPSRATGCRQVLGQRVDARLGELVGRGGDGGDRGDGGHVDDRSPPGRPHHRQDGLARAPHGLEVDLEDPVPRVLAQRCRPTVPGADADVVVEDVDLPVCRQGRVGDACARRRIDDVGLVGLRLASVVLDQPDGLRRRVEPAIDHQHPGALPGEQDRRRPAVADGVARRLPSTDHDGHLAGQPSLCTHALLRSRAGPYAVRSRRGSGPRRLRPLSGHSLWCRPSGWTHARPVGRRASPRQRRGPAWPVGSRWSTTWSSTASRTSSPTSAPACGARFFDRRNACASCSGTEFRTVPIATDGEVRAFTIVSLAAPGIPVPFVAA